MKRIIYDIETTGLDPKEKGFKVHCMCTHDYDTKESRSFYGDSLLEGVDYLHTADLLVGHYAQFFDRIVLEYVYNTKFKAKNFDTKLMATLMRNEEGSHGLKAWGLRLGVLKGSFRDEGEFSTFSEDMLKYCEQDVVVTTALYTHLLSLNWSQESVDLETDFASEIIKQMDTGVGFDEEKAIALYLNLKAQSEQLQTTLRSAFKPWLSLDKEFTPKKDDKNKGYTAGATFSKIKFNIFNPNSNDHIADRFLKLYRWRPLKLTPTGKPVVDEEVLSSLEYPEAKLLSQAASVNKLLGMIAEGESAWLKLSTKGRLYPRYNTNGAVTGRMTCSKPNVQQVPSNEAFLGKECRELFIPDKGLVMVGIDASGIELRCLAHYMGKYDHGAYAQIVAHGDVHDVNRQSLGLSQTVANRNLSKRFVYATLYGAGDE